MTRVDANALRARIISKKATNDETEKLNLGIGKESHIQAVDFFLQSCILI